jgi:hypothetical protein
MAQSTLVSDEVWAQLDPGAGRPPRRSRRAIMVAAWLVAVLLFGWYVAGISGLVWPRLHAEGGWSAQFSSLDRTASQTFTLTNDGWAAVTVTGAASPVPDVQVTGVDGAPLTIRAGEQVSVTVHYRVTGCPAFVDDPGQAPPIRLRTSHWWGNFAAPVSEIPYPAFESACG